MTGLEFEHAIIDAIATYIEQSGKKHAPVAAAAWPEAKNAVWEAQPNLRTCTGDRRIIPVTLSLKLYMMVATEVSRL